MKVTLKNAGNMTDEEIKLSSEKQTKEAEQDKEPTVMDSWREIPTFGKFVLSCLLLVTLWIVGSIVYHIGYDIIDNVLWWGDKNHRNALHHSPSGQEYISVEQQCKNEGLKY